MASQGGVDGLISAGGGNGAAEKVDKSAMTPEEVRGEVAGGAAAGGSRLAATQAFRRFDKDNSGLIDYDEFKAMLPELGLFLKSVGEGGRSSCGPGLTRTRPFLRGNVIPARRK